MPKSKSTTGSESVSDILDDITSNPSLQRRVAYSSVHMTENSRPSSFFILSSPQPLELEIDYSLYQDDPQHTELDNFEFGETFLDDMTSLLEVYTSTNTKDGHLSGGSEDSEDEDFDSIISDSSDSDDEIDYDEWNVSGSGDPLNESSRKSKRNKSKSTKKVPSARKKRGRSDFDPSIEYPKLFSQLHLETAIPKKQAPMHKKFGLLLSYKGSESANGPQSGSIQSTSSGPITSQDAQSSRELGEDYKNTLETHEKIKNQRQMMFKELQELQESAFNKIEQERLAKEEEEELQSQSNPDHNNGGQGNQDANHQLGYGPGGQHFEQPPPPPIPPSIDNFDPYRAVSVAQSFLPASYSWNEMHRNNYAQPFKLDKTARFAPIDPKTMQNRTLGSAPLLQYKVIEAQNLAATTKSQNRSRKANQPKKVFRIPPLSLPVEYPKSMNEAMKMNLVSSSNTSQFKNALSKLINTHLSQYYRQGRITDKQDFMYLCRKIRKNLLNKEVRFQVASQVHARKKLFHKVAYAGLRKSTLSTKDIIKAAKKKWKMKPLKLVLNNGAKSRAIEIIDEFFDTFEGQWYPALTDPFTFENKPHYFVPLLEPFSPEI